MAPLGVAGIVGVVLFRRASIAVPFLSLSFALFGLQWIVILWKAGTVGASYMVSQAVAQTVLFAYLCLGVPFRNATAIVGAITGAMLALLLWQETTSADFIWIFASLGAIVSVATYGAYRYEWAQRDRYVAERKYSHEYERRLATERDRGAWLGLIAGFVRHELKNSIAGLGTSLQLIARAQSDEKRTEYLARANHSLAFMRHFLQRVGDATNVESALKHQEIEPVALSTLIAGRVEDFRLQVPDRVFEVTIDKNLDVLGNADSLVQMLDKLLNNAIEHSAPGAVVRVAAQRVAENASLAIENRGEALPEDIDGLFRPFVSSKLSVGEGNLGLGLYVARVIAEHHGGSVRAEALMEPDGARFMVSLPVLKAKPTASHGSIPS